MEVELQQTNKQTNKQTKKDQANDTFPIFGFRRRTHILLHKY